MTITQIKELDLILGGLLTILLCLGCSFNIVSFIYFKKQKSLLSNNNKNYFRQIYMSVILSDLALSLLVLPSIEAAFTTEREGIMATRPIFCEVDAPINWIVTHSSVLLVGLLSISRLILLKRPTSVLRPILFHLVLGSYAAVVVVICSVWFIQGRIHAFFRREWLYCTLFSIPLEDHNSSRLVTELENMTGRSLTIIANFVPLCAFFVILSSFFLSLVQLNKSGQVSTLVGGSTAPQRHASTTVVIVTLIYLLCNTPTIAMLIGALVKMSTAGEEDVKEVTAAHYFYKYFTSLSKVTHLENYAFTFFYLIPVTLNSVLNPVVYYVRIKEFRAFVKKLSRIVKN